MNGNVIRNKDISWPYEDHGFVDATEAYIKMPYFVYVDCEYPIRYDRWYTLYDGDKVFALTYRHRHGKLLTVNYYEK